MWATKKKSLSPTEKIDGSSVYLKNKKTWGKKYDSISGGHWVTVNGKHMLIKE